MAEEIKYSCEQDILCGVRIPKDINALTELEQKYLPVITAPEKVKKDEVFEVIIPIKLTHAHGPLKAWAKCNLHGLWEGIKDIEIES